MTTYDDTNLSHNYVKGRICTRIIHLVNKIVMGWFPKLQANVKTATCGSEFTALRTAVDQIHNLYYTARSLGVLWVLTISLEIIYLPLSVPQNLMVKLQSVGIFSVSIEFKRLLHIPLYVLFILTVRIILLMFYPSMLQVACGMNL